MTTTTTRSKSTTKKAPQAVGSHGGLTVYVTPSGGVKVGSKSPVLTASELFSGMTKGEARKVRKMLHKGGARLPGGGTALLRSRGRPEKKEMRPWIG